MAVLPAFTTGQVFTSAAANDMANSGLTYISTTSFSGSTAAQFQSCFTSTYTNYHALITYNAASASAAYLRWLVGSTVQTGNILSLSIGASISGGASVSANNRSDQYALFPAGYATYPTTIALDIFSPETVSYTSFNYGSAILGTSNTDAIWAAGGGRNIATTQINGFEITTAGGPNLSGTMTLYGYRKA